MARPRVRPLINTYCFYCKAPLVVPENKKHNKLGRYYCNRVCYESYLRIRPSSEVHRIHSKDDLLAEINRLSIKLHRFPTTTDIKEHSSITLKVFAAHFGSWENLQKALGNKNRYLTFEAKNITPEDGSWLSGIIDGEGCFHLSKPYLSNISGKSKAYAARFTVSIRTDDEPMLNEIQRILGVSKWLHIDNRQASIANGMKANPAFKITISDVPTLLFQLMPTIEKYPLRSKKQYEIPVFKLALTLLFNKRSSGYKNNAYNDTERDILDKIYHCLKELKVFQSDKKATIAKYGLTELIENPDKLNNIVNEPRPSKRISLL